MRSAFMISVVVSVGLALVSIRSMPGQEKAKPVVIVDDGTDAFQKEAAGNFVVVITGDVALAQSTLPLEKARLRMVGGRRFLTGSYTADHQLKGTTTNVAWESVSEFVIMTPDTFRKWVAMSRK